MSRNYPNSRRKRKNLKPYPPKNSSKKKQKNLKTKKKRLYGGMEKKLVNHTKQAIENENQEYEWDAVKFKFKKKEKKAHFTMNVGAKEFVPSFKKTPTAALIVTVSKNGDDPQEINVKSSDKIFDAILKEFEYELEDIQAIYLGDSQEIYPDNSFEEVGIQDGARLNLILEYPEVASQKKCEKWLNDRRKEYPTSHKVGSLIRYDIRKNMWYIQNIELRYGVGIVKSNIPYNADDIGCDLASYLDENNRWEKLDDDEAILWGLPRRIGERIVDVWMRLPDENDLYNLEIYERLGKEGLNPDLYQAINSVRRMGRRNY